MTICILRWASLCHRFRYLMTLYKDVSMLSLRQRLARVIQRIAMGQDPHPQKPQLLEISQQDLANMLSASRQSVAKELKQLEQDGMIAMHYGKITILDLDQIARSYERLISEEQLTPTYNSSE